MFGLGKIKSLIIDDKIEEYNTNTNLYKERYPKTRTRKELIRNSSNLDPKEIYENKKRELYEGSCETCWYFNQKSNTQKICTVNNSPIHDMHIMRLGCMDFSEYGK